LRPAARTVATDSVDVVNAGTPARAAGPSTLISVIVLVVGLVVGGFGLYRAVDPLLDAFLSSPEFPIPNESEMRLREGTYLVYERTRSALRFDTGDTTISPGDVTVTSPDGDRLLVRTYLGDEELSRAGHTYTSTVGFEVPEEGLYRVRIDATTPGRVIVARPLTDTFADTLAWWGVAALGAAGVVTGGVMWIVGAARRRRQRQAQMYMHYGAYGAAPPGWYADPQQPGRLRYWNGTAWTEHVN
jgi:hypothetical protein